MRHLVPVALAFSIAGCSEVSPPQVRVFVDPVTGESSTMVVHNLPGWEATQFQDAPQGFIALSQEGRLVVSVLGEPPGREVIVHGNPSGSEQAWIRTEEDGAIREIELFSEGGLYYLRRDGKEWALTRIGAPDGTERNSATRP